MAPGLFVRPRRKMFDRLAKKQTVAACARQELPDEHGREVPGRVAAKAISDRQRGRSETYPATVASTPGADLFRCHGRRRANDCKRPGITRRLGLPVRDYRVSPLSTAPEVA